LAFAGVDDSAAFFEEALRGVCEVLLEVSSVFFDLSAFFEDEAEEAAGFLRLV
jgi:hypothetical protein